MLEAGGASQDGRAALLCHGVLRAQPHQRRDRGAIRIFRSMARIATSSANYATHLRKDDGDAAGAKESPRQEVSVRNFERRPPHSLEMRPWRTGSAAESVGSGINASTPIVSSKMSSQYASRWISWIEGPSVLTACLAVN